MEMVLEQPASPPEGCVIFGNMRKNPRKHKHGIVWPDKYQWETRLAARLTKDLRAKAAYLSLKQQGCLRENILHCLYAFTVGSDPVRQDKSLARARVLGGLRAVSDRLGRAAKAMQELLDTKWRSQPTFAAYLAECSLDIQIISETGEATHAKRPLDLVLHLPGTLQGYATFMESLRKELQTHLSVRKVGKSIYLAELVTYIEAVTRRPVEWEALAELVNASQLQKSEDKPVDGELLRKNFDGFVRRNKEIYEQIRIVVSEYLTACQELPEMERPTLSRWNRERRTPKS